MKAEIRKFYSFLWAAILANLASTLAMIVDSIIAGHLLGPVGLAAITSLQPVNQFIFAVTVLLNTGSAMLVAYAIGERDDRGIRGYFSFSMLMNAVAAGVMLVSGLLLTGALARFTSNDPAIYDSAVTYGRIMISTGGLMIIMFGTNAFVRTDNAPKLVALAVFIANAVNLVCDILFMKYFGWGIAGAAWATAVGYVTGILVVSVHFRRTGCRLALTGEWRMINRSAAVYIGLPMVVDTTCMFLRLLLVNNMILSVESASGLAVMSVAMNTLLVVNLFLGGTGQAMQGIGGVCLGAGDTESFSSMVRRSSVIILVMSLAVFAVVEFCPGGVAALFNLDADGAIYDSAIRSLKLFAWCMPGFGLAFVFEAACLVRKQTVAAMIIAVFHTLTVAAVMAVTLKAGGISIWHSFWIGETLATILSFITYLVAGRLAARRILSE